MSEANENLTALVDGAERLAVVGSPSSTTELALDVLGSAVTRKLVGELALFQFQQDSSPHYALGQIMEIQLKNVWHEDPTMRSLIRQRGRVDAVSERQDTHLGKMGVSAVFREGGSAGYEASMLGTVPPTGTRIHLATDTVLNELLRPYREQIFYLGHVYGSQPKLPLWFKHFDKGPTGAGEAHHLGIFGKTGSGKSVLAKMILLAYARYPQMALLVIDPQGEFARDLKRNRSPGDFALPVADVLDRLGKNRFTLTVRNLVLDRWELFEQILAESRFFERLTIRPGENRQTACRELADRLQKAKVELKSLYERASFDRAWRLLGEERVQKVFYRTTDSRARFAEALRDADPDEFFAEQWAPVAQLFREDRPGASSVQKALARLLRTDAGSDRPLLVVDLSKEQAKGLLWNDRIQSLVIKRLLDGLKDSAEYFYGQGKSLNALVVVDEAHRLAPQELPRDDASARGVRSVLIDAARTTRKYGLGWLFISQTLSSLDREILQQLRILFFGFGLGLGQEFHSLRQLVGSPGPALDLYQSFRDPHSAFDVASRQYSFMTIGPVSPLSFSGTPLFLNVFNTAAAFMAANRLEAADGGDSPELPSLFSV